MSKASTPPSRPGPKGVPRPRDAAPRPTGKGSRRPGPAPARRTTVAASLGTSLAAACLVLAAGCESFTGGSVQPAGFTSAQTQRAGATGGGQTNTREIAGDAEDIDAAVAVALTKSRLASIEVERPGDGVVVHRVRNLRGERGRVRIQPAEDLGDGAYRFVVRVRVGRFGRPDQERAFLDAFEQRLTELRGVDVAPIR